MVALPMVFTGDMFTQAAHISAMITHAHPNAPAATEVLCWLHRAILEDGVLDSERVRKFASLSRDAGHPEVVAEGLEAAVYWVRENPNSDWLDEQAIPTYDGGWRSVSAVGLAVAACLRWGPDPARVIDKAARIDGDSDSVAAIAGMLIGAAQPDRLPAAWLKGLYQRDGIEELTERLCAMDLRGPHPASD